MRPASQRLSVFSSRVPALTSEEIGLRVRHRLARQAVSFPYEVVIHEAALRIRVGDRAVSRAQLRRLAELSEADHVTLRVIPFDMDDFSGASSAHGVCRWLAAKVGHGGA